MNQEKYSKYLDKLSKYIMPYMNNKINILQLGCYNKEVFTIFLDRIENTKSHIFCIDTFKRDIKYKGTPDYTTFKTHFYNIIKKSDKKKQVTVIKSSINDGLEKLKSEKKYLFDIIYIDSSYDHKGFLYKIILSWELLKHDGIIIFDNCECYRVEDKELCPFFAIESFMKIYNNNIKDITHIKHPDNYNFFEKENENNVTSKISEQFVIKKVSDKIIIDEDKKIVEVMNNLLEFRMPKEEYSVPSLDIEKLDWNAEYYTDEELKDNFIEKHIRKIDTKNEIDISFLNIMLDYNNNYYNKKYLNINIFDYNYLTHINKYSYNILIKYIKKYINLKNDIYSIEYILNIFLDKNKILKFILSKDYLYIQNINKKNISILQLGSKKSDSIFKDEFVNYINNLYQKNIILYQIYNPEIKNNTNKNNIIKFIPSKINSYENILKINILDKKMDYIFYNKVSFFDNKFIDSNINNLYIFNNSYVYLLYLALLKQRKGGYLYFPMYIIFTNIFYQIIYILNIYYENIELQIKKYSTISDLHIIILCKKFKGININNLNKLKNIIFDPLVIL